MISSVKLTPVELQTAMYEAANFTNEIPIGLNKTPSADGTDKVLTTNFLLMGRSLSAVLDISNVGDGMKKAERY